MKVVAFNGSARKDGNTAILIREVFKELEKEGIKTELFQLAGKNIHGCLACYKCVAAKNKRCAGFVAKANDSLFKRKIAAAVVSVRRGGAIHNFDSLNHFFTISQMIVVGSAYWNIGVGRDIGDVEKDEEGILTMSILGKNMAWLLKKINQ